MLPGRRCGDQHSKTHSKDGGVRKKGERVERTGRKIGIRETERETQEV